MPATPGFTPARIKKQTLAFLAAHGIQQIRDLNLWKYRQNSALFRFSDDHYSYLVRWHAETPISYQDAFYSEKNFFHVAWERGIRPLPEVLFWDKEYRMALLRTPPSNPVEEKDIELKLVSKALAFLMNLNRIRPFMAGRGFTMNATAAFSFEAHLTAINRLVATLEKKADERLINKPTAAFVKEELEPSWQIIRELLVQNARKLGIEMGARLAISERCIHPGNFGFHSALRTEDGSLLFCDFSQAGWDDPAQVICDFFSHPESPVSDCFWLSFAEAFVRSLGQDKTTADRARILLPAIRIKWTCRILLDTSTIETTPVNTKSSPQQQLEKARMMFDSIRNLNSTFFNLVENLKNT